MKIPPELESVLTASDDTLSGAVRFVGTRVPVQALLDTIRNGHDVDYFLEGFPGVTRDQAEAVLHWQDNCSRQALGLDRAS